MKRLTQEFVEQKINERCIEKNYKLIEDFTYKNSQTKIKLRCNIDDYEWEVSFYKFIYQNKICPKCCENLKLTQKDVEFNVNKRCCEINYKLIEPFVYKNNETKIHLMCNKDNHEWYVTYGKFINSKTKCPKCYGKIKLTQNHTEFNINKKCKEKNYKLVEPFIYKNSNTKFKLKCNNDDYEWEVSYHNFIINNTNCPKCSKRSNIIKTNQIDAENLILEKCEEKNYKLIKSFIYEGCNSKVYLKCNNDNHEWYSTYTNFIYKNAGCPKCKGILKLTNEEANIKLLERCNEINTILTQPLIYKNNRSRIFLKCNKDNHEWSTTYQEFVVRKRGCAKCANVAKITQEEAEYKVNMRCKKMNYMLMESFIMTSIYTKIKIKCITCKHEWIVVYNNFIKNETGCPKCNQSKGELKIVDYLNNKNIKYIREYKFDECKYKRKLLFDFYLPSHNICIEYDGEQHFFSRNCWGGEKEFKIIQLRDKIKTEYCEKNKIGLIRIKYTENIIDVLNEKLLTKFNLNNEQI